MMFWRRQLEPRSEMLAESARKTLGTFSKRAPRVRIVTERRSNSNWLTGILFGITAGLTIGFLTAPARGDQTRTQVAKRWGEYTKDMPVRTTGMVETVRHARQTIMDRFGGATTKG